MTPLIIIPARYGSTRLPGKSLEVIGKHPMIVHVWQRACAAGIAPVVVATDDTRIRDVVEAEGGHVCMTTKDHASGTDRVYDALCAYDPHGVYTHIINLQGDLPTINSHTIKDILTPFVEHKMCDMTTLVTPIRSQEEKENPNVVKAICSFMPGRAGRALYFTRACAPYGKGPAYHHIGIYGFSRDALRQFISWAPSPLETQEKLEQLRALENGMHIYAHCIDAAPLGVDTHADLEKIRSEFKV